MPALVVVEERRLVVHPDRAPVARPHPVLVAPWLFGGDGGEVVAEHPLPIVGMQGIRPRIRVLRSTPPAGSPVMSSTCGLAYMVFMLVSGAST